jgi:hypothetical protein
MQNGSEPAADKGPAPQRTEGLERIGQEIERQLRRDPEHFGQTIHADSAFAGLTGIGALLGCTSTRRQHQKSHSTDVGVHLQGEFCAYLDLRFLRGECFLQVVRWHGIRARARLLSLSSGLFH